MKTVVITGGNGGMGKAAAVALASKGYRVLIHGRNAETTKSAFDEIKARSNNSNVEMIIGDMSSVAGMKAVTRQVKDKTDQVDRLILSTGVIMSRRIETADGLDTAFATQYLCRFAVVKELMPLLQKVPNARVVHIGAPTMKKATIYFDDLSLKKNFSMLRSMGQAMLSNHLFVQEFARRYAGSTVSMNLHHVGIARTGVAREINFFFRSFIKTFGTSPEKAVKNTLYLADDETAHFSGYYLPKPGKPQVKELIGFDPVLAKKLWDTSVQIVS